LISSRGCVITVARLLAVGMLVSAASATALADSGSDGSRVGGKSSASAGHVAGGPRHARHQGARSAGGQSDAKQDGDQSVGDHAATTRRPGHRPQSGVGADDRDGVTKPTTRITRNRTTVTSRQLSTGNATPADVATVGEPNVGTADDTADDTPGNAMTFQALTVDATTEDDATATNSPAPQPDPAPTTNEASPPVTQELTPSPTEDASPVADSQTSTAPTTDAALPVLPTSDPPPLGSDLPSTAPTASAPDGGSTSPELVTQDTAASATGPTDTPATPDATAPTPPPPAPVLEVTTEGIITTEEAGVDGLAADDDLNNRRRAAARDASPLQILRMLTLPSGPSMAAKSNGIPTLLEVPDHGHPSSGASTSGTNSASAGASAPSAATQLDPGTGLPRGLQTFLHTYGKVIVAVSLSAMFAAALPGLAGLLIPALAGTHIGYRQAKAGRALRTSNIAHLAPSAPIGVVRSGTLIALRPTRRRPPAMEMAGTHGAAAHQDVA
jgi:hypothetical protein